MIRRLEPETLPLFSALLAGDGFLGGRIRTAWQCYRQHPTLCGFYLADDTGALMLLGDGALLCGSADPDELGAFLAFSGVARFQGGAVAPAGYRPTTRLLMRHTGSIPPDSPKRPNHGPVTLDTAPNLWALAHAGLLAGTDPGAFYADACLRRNRGLAQIIAFRAGNTYVATAGVYSLQPQSATITAVATHPAWRGQGLAGTLVALLARQYAPRPVHLLCAPALERFYQKLGFQTEGTLPEYTQKGDDR